MTKPLTLTSRDRDFFHTVSLAAVANPFSPERKALDRAIAANDSTPSDDKALIDVVTDRVAGRLETLRKEQRNDPLRYQGKDRRLLQTAFQFEIYHRFRAPFDAFILSQQKAGDRPIKLPFVREVLAELGRLGYSNQDSLRYLEIFYQIRRAFYFIDTALVGVAPCMHTLRLQIWNNIFTRDINLYDQHLWNKMEDFSTLLLGETGTGKGAAAAAIGCSGFIPFDEKTVASRRALPAASSAVICPSTRNHCLNRNCLATAKGPLLALLIITKGFSRTVHPMAPFSWMKSATYRYQCRSSCCKCCKNGPSVRWAVTSACVSMAG